jgi:hypothetical protein
MDPSRRILTIFATIRNEYRQHLVSSNPETLDYSAGPDYSGFRTWTGRSGTQTGLSPASLCKRASSAFNWVTILAYLGS